MQKDMNRMMGELSKSQHDSGTPNKGSAGKGAGKGSGKGAGKGGAEKPGGNAAAPVPKTGNNLDKHDPL